MLYRTVQRVYKNSVRTRLDLRPRDRTRTGQDATGRSSLHIHLVAPVWLLMSGCCIAEYRGFTKIPFAPDWIHGLGIVHILDTTLRGVPVYVYILWHLYDFLYQDAAYNSTGGLQEYRLHQTRSHGMVNWHSRSRNRTPKLRGDMGPPSLCVQLM